MNLRNRIIIKGILLLLIFFYSSSPLYFLRENYIEKEQAKIIGLMAESYTARESSVKDQFGRGYGEIAFTGETETIASRLKEIMSELGYTEKALTGEATPEQQGKIFLYEKPLGALWGDSIGAMIDTSQESRVELHSGISQSLVELAAVAFILVWLLLTFVADIMRYRKLKAKAKK